MMTGAVMTIGKTVMAGGLAAMLMAPAAFAGPDEQPGERFEFSVADLPPPGTAKMAVNVSKVVPREPGDRLRLPPGFKATLFADEGLVQPRWMAVAPNGDVFVTEPSSPFRKRDDANKVVVLRDEDGDGDADLLTVFAEGFDMPMGLAFVEGALLVADTRGVWRLPYSQGALRAESRVRLTPEGALGTKVGSHYQRILALDPDGEHMYVTVGSTANVLEDPAPHASVQRFRLDGSEQTTFASGLRNPIGMAFYPGTRDLYVVVNERDGYGDDLVPDYLTRIQEGQFYGWPYAYMGPHPDPKFGDKRPDLVAKTATPDVLFQSHSAPVGLVFYDGDQFPEDYRGDAFVAFHGSWNRAAATGYKIVRVKFENGRPVGWYDNFATGFWRADLKRPKVWGRPAGLLVMPDGSLLVAEDANDTIWRISYEGSE